MISVLPKSQALPKSRSKLKILNLNRLLLSGKNRNYRKNKGHWISSDRISQHCLMLLKYQTTISLVPLHPLFNISVCNVLRRIIGQEVNNYFIYDYFFNTPFYLTLTAKRLLLENFLKNFLSCGTDRRKQQNSPGRS